MANNLLLASDNFASGSLAAGWSTQPSSGFALCQVSAAPHYLEPPSATAEGMQVWTGLTWPSEQVSEITIQAATNAYFEILVRMQPNAFSGYAAVIATSGSQATIYRFDAGVATALSPVAALTPNIAPGDVFSFTATGSYLILYRNWVQVGYWGDATYTGGNPGIALETFGSAPVTGTQISSWRGYSIQEQDGVWTKLGATIPATASDLTTGGGNGPTNISPILYEGNPHLISANADGNVYKVWISVGTAAGQGIYYAESNDAINWTRRSAAVLTNYMTPCVVKDGSIYYMFAQPEPIGTSPLDVYSSSDGITWTLLASGVLGIGTSGQWDDTQIWDMAVQKISGTWYAFYSASHSTVGPFSTGLATASTPSGPWTKYSGNPVISNAYTTFFPILINGIYYNWILNAVGGTGGSRPAFSPGSTYRMQSTDLIHWSPSAKSFHVNAAAESVNMTYGQCYPNWIMNVGPKAYAYLTEALDDYAPDAAPFSNRYQMSLATGPPLQSLVQAGEDAVAKLASDTFVQPPGDLSANWTTPTGSTKLTVNASGNVQATVLTTKCAMCYSGQSSSTDQYSEMTIGTVAQNSYMYLIVRSQTGSNSWYQGVLTYTGTKNSIASISRVVNGAETQIGPSITTTPQVGDVWRLQVVGNVLTLFQNGYLIVQVEDELNQFSSGYPGIAIYAATSLGTANITGWAGGNANVMPVYPASSGAAQGVNIYGFTVYLKSKLARGEHIGMQVAAVGATPAAAQQVLVQQFGSDLSQPPFGGILVCGPAYTTLS